MVIGLAAGCMLLVASVSRLFFLHHGWTELVRKSSLARLDPIAVGVLLAIALEGRVPRIRTGQRVGTVGAGLALWLVVSTFCSLNSSIAGTMIGYPVIAIG